MAKREPTKDGLIIKFTKQVGMKDFYSALERTRYEIQLPGNAGEFVCVKRKLLLTMLSLLEKL